MKSKHIIYKILTCLAIWTLVGQPLSAQMDKDDDRPQQLDILKINVSQFIINEARILYEIQVGPQSSIEIGAGYIYKNAAWFERGGRQMLASGAGAYFSYRKYFVRKSVFYQPKILSYISPMIFYRRTGYKDEWLLFGDGTENNSECERFEETINHLGVVIRIGWQTRVGRAALDFYGGLGFKWQPSELISTAFNDSTTVCEILPTSDLSQATLTDSPVNVILNAGVKIGLRRNNRERNFKDRDDVDPIRKDDPQSPPKF